MITERRLRNLRRNALVVHERLSILSKEAITTDTLLLKECVKNVIDLTQDLLDLHLMKRG